jgi:hypothetical protein
MRTKRPEERILLVICVECRMRRLSMLRLSGCRREFAEW